MLGDVSTQIATWHTTRTNNCPSSGTRPIHFGVVLAIRLGFESWFWVGVLFLVCDIGDDKATDVTQDVPYTGV